MVNGRMAAAMLATPIALFAGGESADAGWKLFGGQNTECCEPCPACGKEKKCKLFSPADPPRAGVVEAAPARLTTARADRAPAPAPAPPQPIPPLPAASCTAGNGAAMNNPVDAQKLAQMEQDVRELKLQLQALVRHLQDKETTP